MIDKNPQALALAYKKCKGKIQKIQELKITPTMKEAKIETLIENLATAKAVEKATNISEVVAGQRWYVEGLVKFSGLTVEEQLNSEYEDSFADSASEGEMLKALGNLSA
jgi:hypothetical protein